MECVLNFLMIINKDYSQLLIFLVALLSLFLVYREYISKRRPYIFPEIKFENLNNNWYFHFILKNSGSYPAQVKVNKAQLKIGDEIYPTEFTSEMLVQNGEINKLLPIGHINIIGRENIINNRYSVNRVEIEFKISSKSIGDKKYKYHTSVIYGVDVSGNTPIVQLVSENFS